MILDSITQLIKTAGGRPFFVGGYPRDLIMGVTKPPKDIDIEVFGLSYDNIKDTLSKAGYKADEVGKSFGVVKTKLGSIDIDISLPRTEKKIGDGHKGFEVSCNPNLNLYEACLRRDFTMNAIAIDDEGNIHDPFGGISDIYAKKIKAVSPNSFSEDPLRVLRVMQFAGRFDFVVEDNTAELAKDSLKEYDSISIERIWTEWHKLLMKAKKPSAGILALQKCGGLIKYNELACLIGVPQPFLHHQEGDAFTHTLMVLDEAAKLFYEDDKQKLIVMLAALTHDLGKATTTKIRKGKVTAYSHEKELHLVVSLMKKIGASPNLAGEVCALVKNHMCPHQFKQATKKSRFVKKLAVSVEPSDIYTLSKLLIADGLGKIPASDNKYVYNILNIAIDNECLLQRCPPLLNGEDLISLGYIPGKNLGEILKSVYEQQINERINNREQAINYVESNYAECKQKT